MFHLAFCLCTCQFLAFLLLVLEDNRHVELEFIRAEVDAYRPELGHDRNFYSVPWSLHFSQLTVLSTHICSEQKSLVCGPYVVDIAAT